MNKVDLIGRMTDIPVLRYTGSNKAFTRFSVAINRQKKEDGTQEADFINCIAWDKTAEHICTYLTKGSLFAIEGRIQTGKYTRPDGSTGYTTDVLVQRIEFLESKKSGQETTNNGQQITSEEVEQNTIDPFSDFGNQVDIDSFLD